VCPRVWGLPRLAEDAEALPSVQLTVEAADRQNQLGSGVDDEVVEVCGWGVAVGAGVQEIVKGRPLSGGEHHRTVGDGRKSV
jgi:hypothetical protein